MDMQQAIRLLHPDTTREALEELAEVEYYGGFEGHKRRVELINEACLVACDTMQRVLDGRLIPNTKEDNPCTRQ